MLRLLPQYKSLPWGGRRLTEEFGRALPEGPIGESWEVAAFGEHQSVVADGPYEGRLLGELWREGVLGGRAQGEFPFLVKWLDTQGALSVQVHPTQEACARLGTGRPKSEAWLVVARDPEARMYLGHYPGLDAATLTQAAQGGTVHKWLYESAPKPGDMFYVPSGTLHAVGAGFLILEVQEPSDTTFRVYDWNRLGLDGRPRPLHLEQASVAVNFAAAGAHPAVRHQVRGPSFSMTQLTPREVTPAQALRVFVAEAGPAVLRTRREEVVLQPGDVRIAEANDGDITLATGKCVLVSEP